MSNLPRTWGNEVIRRAASVTQNNLSKSEKILQNATPFRKSAPWPLNMSVSCTAPARRHASWQTLFTPSFLQLLQNLHILLTFDKVQNPLRLPWKTTRERPKLLPTCGAFDMLTSGCASRHLALPHTCVHFWKKHPSKSTTRLRCLKHFTWTRALRHSRMHFSHIATSNLLQRWGVLGMFMSTCASRHNGVHCVLFHLTRWLRAQPWFSPKKIWQRKLWASLLVDPPEPQNIGKTQCFATFLPFPEPWSSFYWLFLFCLFLFWLFLFSGCSHHCCCISPYITLCVVLLDYSVPNYLYHNILTLYYIILYDIILYYIYTVMCHTIYYNTYVLYYTILLYYHEIWCFMCIPRSSGAGCSHLAAPTMALHSVWPSTTMRREPKVEQPLALGSDMNEMWIGYKDRILIDIDWHWLTLIDILATLRCHETWLAGKSPNQMEVSFAGKIIELHGGFSSKLCFDCQRVPG